MEVNLYEGKSVRSQRNPQSSSIKWLKQIKKKKKKRLFDWFVIKHFLLDYVLLKKGATYALIWLYVWYANSSWYYLLADTSVRFSSNAPIN